MSVITTPSELFAYLSTPPERVSVVFNLSQIYENCEDELEPCERYNILDNYRVLLREDATDSEKIRAFKYFIDVAGRYTGTNTIRALLLILFTCAKTPFIIETMEQNSRFDEVVRRKYNDCFEMYENTQPEFVEALRGLQL